MHLAEICPANGKVRKRENYHDRGNPREYTLRQREFKEREKLLKFIQEGGGRYQ